MTELPLRFEEELASKPETGMGYQVVTLTLGDDGRRFDRVVVVEGKVTQIKGMTRIPFSGEQVRQVILTHDKWDFSKEP